MQYWQRGVMRRYMYIKRQARLSIVIDGFRFFNAILTTMKYHFLHIACSAVIKRQLDPAQGKTAKCWNWWEIGVYKVVTLGVGGLRSTLDLHEIAVSKLGSKMSNLVIIAKKDHGSFKTDQNRALKSNFKRRWHLVFGTVKIVRLGVTENKLA